MADKTDSKRLVDLKAALKAAKPKDLIKLEELASLWGTSKQRFVTKRREFVGFPEPVEKEGNAFLYPLKPCLQALIANIERHQQASTSKAKRLGELIGIDHMAEHVGGGFSVAELAKANQLAADLEQRQRDQGLWAQLSDVQRIVGLVFSEVSETLSNLSNIVDPHGRLLPETRQHIDKAGHEQLLRMHSNLKRMLTQDALDGATGSEARKPRKAPARRKGSGSRPRKAR